MSEFIYIWLYTIALKCTTIGGGMFGIGLGAIAIVGVSCELDVSDDESGYEVPRALLWTVKGWFVAAAVITAVGIITPSKSDLAWIIGGGVALKVVQNEEVQQLPESMARMLNEFVEQEDQQ